MPTWRHRLYRSTWLLPLLIACGIATLCLILILAVIFIARDREHNQRIAKVNRALILQERKQRQQLRNQAIYSTYVTCRSLGRNRSDCLRISRGTLLEPELDLEELVSKIASLGEVEVKKLTVTGPEGPGIKSVHGPPGPKGPPGPQGEPGPKGATGAQGPPGPQGERGATGARGPQGERGPAGAAAAVGARGPAGPRGEPGPPGETGLAGPPGPAGTTGPPGPPGGTGPPGATGPPGLSCPPGYTAAPLSINSPGGQRNLWVCQQ